MGGKLRCCCSQLPQSLLCSSRDGHEICRELYQPQDVNTRRRHPPDASPVSMQGSQPPLLRARHMNENGGGEEQNVAGVHLVAAAAWLRRDRERQRFKADGNQHLASRGSGLHAPFLVVHDRMSSGEQRFWASSFWAPMATASSICAVVGDNEQIWASLFVIGDGE
nr:hypothetical protein Iba_chr05cCG0310 [Ipomoea batatas]